MCPQLLATTEALLPEHRERLYPPTVTLSMFMRQVLEADGSCQKAVNGWAAQRAADGLSPCSVRTGGFCRARQRLPLKMVSTLEDLPGPGWAAHAATLWPGYLAWWQRDGERARPTFLVCRKALRQHMPELEPTWNRLSELMGGGDAAARFLSMWCPPPYITGCTQAVWSGKSSEEARLLRNYDFSPALFEGLWMRTQWHGQRVLAMSDCLWGVLGGGADAGPRCGIQRQRGDVGVQLAQLRQSELAGLDVHGSVQGANNEVLYN